MSAKIYKETEFPLVLKIKKNYLFVGRAATAIYLVLRFMNFYKKKILVPANICYAAIYPVIYSGNIPVFCDVDELSGNVTFDICLQFKGKVDGMLLPHMYGNPIQEIEEIASFCHANDIVLIEDCASAMGAMVSGKYCGKWGDFSIFSMGYSKTIDIGGGGILISDYDISSIKKEYQNLPEKTELDECNDIFFSKLYRLIRNNPEQSLSPFIWKSFLNKLQGVFVHYCQDNDQRYITVLKELDTIISIRRNEVELYKKYLIPKSYYEIYVYEKKAVPWRFSLFIQKQYKKKMIAYLLEHDIPVSDWYPVVTPIFGEEKKSFLGAENMERKIINFPLLIGEEKIHWICEIINNFNIKKEYGE